jgi:hypothetical protein
MLAQMALGLATNKTSDLSVCSLQARYVSNLYPKDANTFELPYYTGAWSEGDDIVTVSCPARGGATLYQIEGSVQINGTPMDAMPGGLYSKVIPKGDRGPKTITIVTNSGQKAQFEVKPVTPVNLLTVNGSKDSAPIDMTKDLTLTFGDIPTENTNVRISLLVDSAGMRNFASLGTYKLDKTIKIPAVTFRHPQLFVTSGSVNNSGGRTQSKTLTASSQFTTDANYIVVERFETHPLKLDTVPAAEQVALGWSWKTAKIVSQVPTEPGIVTSGNIKNGSGGVAYVITKPNAYLGKPFSKAKKIAFVSLAMSGKLKRETIKEEHVSSALNSTTTKHDFNGQKIDGPGDQVSTWEFPKVPIAFWDSELENLREDVSSIFQDEFGIELVSLDQIKNTKAYKDLVDPTDTYDDFAISHPYKGNKPLIGSRVGSATFKADRTDIQLLRELGVDGLLVVDFSIDLDISTKGTNKIVSKLVFNVKGDSNDYTGLTTTYADGEVATPEGIAYKLDEFKTAGDLSRVTRRADLVKALRVALKTQEATAKKQGYDTIWAPRPIDSVTNKGLSFLTRAPY